MKTFAFTICVIIVLIWNLIINTLRYYNDGKKILHSYGYSDYAILVDAFKGGFEITKLFASVLIPLAITIDFIILLLT